MRVPSRSTRRLQGPVESADRSAIWRASAQVLPPLLSSHLLNTPGRVVLHAKVSLRRAAIEQLFVKFDRFIGGCPGAAKCALGSEGGRPIAHQYNVLLKQCNIRVVWVQLLDLRRIRLRFRHLLGLDCQLTQPQKRIGTSRPG